MGMFEFRLLRVPCRQDERSDNDDAPNKGDEGVSRHEAEFGDDKTDEERDDDGIVTVVKVVVGCKGAARKPCGG